MEAALRRMPDAADDWAPETTRLAARQARPGRGCMPASFAGCAGWCSCLPSNAKTASARAAGAAVSPSALPPARAGGGPRGGAADVRGPWLPRPAGAGREGAARDASKAARDGACARLRHARRAVGAPSGACAIAAAVAPDEQRACGVAGRASSRAPVTRRMMGGPQEALIVWAPRLLRPAAGMGAAGCALPAELLPSAAAQLLPLLLLPPERVRALELPREYSPPGRADKVSVFLAEVVVSARPPRHRPPCALAALLPGPGASLPVRPRRAPAAGSWRPAAAASARRPCARAKAWCPSSWRRCARWPSAVRAAPVPSACFSAWRPGPRPWLRPLGGAG